MSVSAQQLDAVRWLKQSGSDLVAARQLRDGGSFAQSCFFSQQSAEKLFKGAVRESRERSRFLTERNTRIPWFNRPHSSRFSIPFDFKCGAQGRTRTGTA